MLASKIMVRRNEENMSVKVEYLPVLRSFHFAGHIGESVNLEQAFEWIREAIMQVGKLREG